MVSDVAEENPAILYQDPLLTPLESVGVNHLPTIEAVKVVPDPVIVCVFWVTLTVPVV